MQWMSHNMWDPQVCDFETEKKSVMYNNSNDSHIHSKQGINGTLSASN